MALSSTTDRFNGYVASLAFKVPCVTVSTSNITLNGTPQTIATIVVNSGDRVLVAGQTDPVENGIWIATSSAWKRAPDFDGRRDATKHSLVFVARGAGQSGVIYQVDTDVPFIVGEDAINFSIFIDPDAGGGSIPDHQGEVTGSHSDTVLDPSAISNKVNVVADAVDKALILDDTDASLKQTDLSSITDGGNF
jgi:hypothetical protein